MKIKHSAIGKLLFQNPLSNVMVNLFIFFLQFLIYWSQFDWLGCTTYQRSDTPSGFHTYDWMRFCTSYQSFALVARRLCTDYLIPELYLHYWQVIWLLLIEILGFWPISFGETARCNITKVSSFLKGNHTCQLLQKPIWAFCSWWYFFQLGV